MAKIVVKGSAPFDGEYELDLERAWTIREWNWIKTISGYMPATIDDGLRGNDPMLYVSLAVIAMARNSKIDRDQFVDVADRLQDGDRTSIMLEIEGDDVGPPDLTKDPDVSSENGTPSPNSISGDPSRQSSAPSDASPAPTGTIGSDTSDMLAPTTLAKPHQAI